MIQIKPNEGIEQEYWEKINPRNKDTRSGYKGYSKNPKSLIWRIAEPLQNVCKYTPYHEFLHFLLEQDPKGEYFRLKKIIKSTPRELIEVIDECESKREKLGLKKFAYELSDKQKKKDEYKGVVELHKIFNYESFQKKDGYWFTGELIKANTCAYCNRQYTLTVGSGAKGDKYGSPQLDHFYDKAVYPYLALSLYNLVPSCSSCNGPSGKGKKKKKGDEPTFTIEKNIHPYLEGYDDDARFEIQIKDVASFYGDASKDIGVKLAISRDCDDAKKDRIINNKGVFALDAAYTQHQDVAKELLQKRNMSDGKYLKELQKTYSNWHLSTADAYRLAFGNFYDKDEFIKRPLAKFTRDLAEQLQLILPKKKQEDK
jgi:hypothetical protein